MAKKSRGGGGQSSSSQPPAWQMARGDGYLFLPKDHDRKLVSPTPNGKVRKADQALYRWSLVLHMGLVIIGWLGSWLYRRRLTVVRELSPPDAESHLVSDLDPRPVVLCRAAFSQLAYRPRCANGHPTLARSSRPLNLDSRHRMVCPITSNTNPPTPPLFPFSAILGPSKSPIFFPFPWTRILMV